MLATSSVFVRRSFPLPIGKKKNAFSLVEVLLAIGLVSFAAIAILSLFSVGLRSSRESSEDTVIALMTRQVHAWSRTQDFTQMTDSPSSGATTFFFSSEGIMERTSDGASASGETSDSLYACMVFVRPSGVSTNLLHLQYRFEWPLSAPQETRQQRTIVASLANED